MKLVVFVAAFLVGGCAALGLGPAEQAEIASTASQIAACEAKGHACVADAGMDAGCRLSTYVPCMQEAGLM